MTINSDVRVAGPFAGTGSAQVLPFTFRIFSASDVVVISTDPSGNDTTLVSGYSVAMNADQNASPGGTVTITQPSSSYKTTLTTALANTQPVQLTNGGGFFPTVINDALDRLTVLIQQAVNAASRSLKFPVSDGTSISTTMPTATLRANKVLAFDGSGNATTSSLTISQIESGTVDAAASAVAAAASAGAAATSASAASTSAGNAATSETNAEAARDTALAAVGNVKVSATDTTAGKLTNKVTSTGGTNLISRTTVNGGGDESLNFAVTEATQSEAEAQTDAFKVITARRLTALFSAVQDAATDLNNFSLGTRLTASTGITNLPANWSQGRYLVTTIRSSAASYKHQTIVGVGAGAQEDARVAWRKWNGSTWTSWNTGVGAITTPSTPAIGTAVQWTGPDGWLTFSASTASNVTTITVLQLKVGTTSTPTDVLDAGYFYGHLNANWSTGQQIMLKTPIRSGDWYKIDKVIAAGSDPSPAISFAKFRPLNAL